MTESKHTPEPWHAHTETLEPGLCMVKVTDSDGWRGVVSAFGDTDEEALANARRVAACINACVGIPTEQLESLTRIGGVNDLVDALAASTTQLRDLDCGYPPRELHEPIEDTLKRNRNLLRVGLGVDDEGGWD